MGQKRVLYPKQPIAKGENVSKTCGTRAPQKMPFGIFWWVLPKSLHKAYLWGLWGSLRAFSFWPMAPTLPPRPLRQNSSFRSRGLMKRSMKPSYRWHTGGGTQRQLLRVGFQGFVLFAYWDGYGSKRKAQRGLQFRFILLLLTGFFIDQQPDVAKLGALGFVLG